MKRTMTILWFCLITLYLPLPVNAAIFCVSTSEELRSALTAAASNNQDDEIRLRLGTYTRPDTAFSYSSTQPHALEISGGWGNFCLDNPDPSNVFSTTLSGEREHRALRISSDGDVSISRIHFTRGSQNVGGGMQLIAGTTADVLLDRVAFYDNSSTNFGNSGSALWHSGGQTVTIRNSLFIQNGGNGTTIRFENGNVGLYFINNTVADNGAGVFAASLVLFNDAQTVIANNIFWGNQVTDLRVDVTNDADAFIRHNIIDNYQGPPLNATNIHADPQFFNPIIFATAYRPRSMTPQVEAGTPLLGIVPIPVPFEHNWSVGLRDFLGFDRIQARRVDIGAYEFPLLFQDSFE